MSAGACLLLTAFCAKEPPVSDTKNVQAAAMKTFTKPDQGTVQILARGESFEVRLPENPTTGYVWEVEKIPGAVLDLERETFEAETADPRIMGRGGIKIFVFKAREPGTGEIDLRHRRPWMRDAAIDSFVLKVEIRANE